MFGNPYYPCINIVFESGRKWNRYFYIWFDTQFFGFNLQSEIFINTERVILDANSFSGKGSKAGSPHKSG